MLAPALALCLAVVPAVAHAQDAPPGPPAAAEEQTQDAPPPAPSGLDGGLIENAMKGALHAVVDEVTATLRSWALSLLDTLTGGWVSALQTLDSYNLITQIPTAWLTDNAVVQAAMARARDIAWQAAGPAITAGIALLFIGPFFGSLYRSALAFLGNLALMALALASTGALWAGFLGLSNALSAALWEATTNGRPIGLAFPPNLAAPLMGAWLFLWTCLYVARLVLLVRVAIRIVGHLLSAMLIPLCGMGPWLAWGRAGLGEAVTPILQCLAMSLAMGFLNAVGGLGLPIMEAFLGIASMIAALTAHRMLPHATPSSGPSLRSLLAMAGAAARLAPPMAPVANAAQAAGTAWGAATTVAGRATVRSAPTVWRELGPGVAIQRLPASRTPLALPKP